MTFILGIVLVLVLVLGRRRFWLLMFRLVLLALVLAVICGVVVGALIVWHQYGDPANNQFRSMINGLLVIACLCGAAAALSNYVGGLDRDEAGRQKETKSSGDSRDDR